MALFLIVAIGKILEQLATTLDYDDGTYSGVLTLDHTAIRTEASGYTSQAKTVTAPKTIVRSEGKAVRVIDKRKI